MAGWLACVDGTHQPPARANLLEQFVVDEQNADELRGPDYNVAPTKHAPVVIARASKDAPDDEDPVRQLRSFRWGLLPDYLGLSFA
jgi:putative SOS response-associated peptidase YedK